MAKMILVGAPRSGKSSYARILRANGIPTFCSDPKSLVKDPENDVTYLPEGLDWSDASQYVIDNWLAKDDVRCIEGVATVRALRKVLADGNTDMLKAAAVIRFVNQHSSAVTLPGQVSMKKAIDSIWSEIEPELKKHVPVYEI